MQYTTAVVCQQVPSHSYLWHISIPKARLKQYIFESLHTVTFLFAIIITLLAHFSALTREFEAQNLLSRIHSRRDGVQAVEPSLYFHTVPYSNNLFDTFGKNCVIKDSADALVMLSYTIWFLCVLYF